MSSEPIRDPAADHHLATGLLNPAQCGFMRGE